MQALCEHAPSPLTLLGLKKNITSYYLENFPIWMRLDVAQTVNVDATALRNVFFEGNDPDARLTVIASFLSPGVLQCL